MTDRLLNADQVAERLQLPVDHIYKLARKQQIPHLKFGRTVRFRPASIDSWLAEQERGNGRQ